MSARRTFHVLLVVLSLTIAARAATQDAPTLDEAAALRLELVAVKQQLALATAKAQVCEGQLAPQAYRVTMDTLAQEVAALRADFESAHPGWTLDEGGRPVAKEATP